MSSSKLDPHADEIRAKLDDGVSQRKLATEYGVARSTVQHFIDTRLQVGGFNDCLPQEPEDETEIPVVIRDYSHLRELYVYPLGDVHKGAPGHQRERWNTWLDYLVNTENASMLGTGDFFNVAIKGSKSETYDEELTMMAARQEFQAEVEPLAKSGRIDLMIPGNHEARYYRAVGDCPVSQVCDALDVEYARAAAVVIYLVGDVRYTVFVKHGTGGGQVGARANRLAKQAQTLVADIYVSGHTHSQLVFPQDLYVVEGDKVVRRKQLFISSGSFVGNEEYAIVAGYAPGHIGAPRIRLDGTRHDPHVSV